MTFDLNVEEVEVLLVTSQFLLKGAQNGHFPFAFFLKMSETLKAHISGTEKISTNSKKLSFRFLTDFILANKKSSKILMHRHFNKMIINDGNISLRRHQQPHLRWSFCRLPPHFDQAAITSKYLLS